MGAEEKKKQSVTSVLFYAMEDKRRNSSATHGFDRRCQVTEGLYKHSVCPFWHTRANWGEKFEGKTEGVVGEKLGLCYIGTLNTTTGRMVPHKNFNLLWSL